MDNDDDDDEDDVKTMTMRKMMTVTFEVGQRLRGRPTTYGRQTVNI
jgi:hypothetical protein